jgi:hypothetical protein
MFQFQVQHPSIISIIQVMSYLLCILYLQVQECNQMRLLILFGVLTFMNLMTY